MSNYTSRLERIIKILAEMDEIGSSNDKLSEFVNKGKFIRGSELSVEDLDLVAAATTNPNYKKFIELLLD